MLRIRYRHKVRLRKAGRFLCIALGALLLGGIVILVYADSLITYDRNGAHLGTEPTEIQVESTTQSTRPVIANPIIEIQEEAVAAANIADMGGVYITTSMLQNVEKVTQLIKAMEEPCAVMIELKSDFGNYYYSSPSANGNHPEGIDVAAVDSLLAYLEENGFYMIASVPAFPDRAYVLENESCCIRVSGGYGWMDSRGCYWLDPTHSATVSHITQIVRELSERGFREICFTDFRFPEGDGYLYGSDKSKTQVIQELAEQLSQQFTQSGVLISFATGQTDFPVAGGRVYVTGVDGSQVDRYANAYKEVENCREVVFLTNSRDARFDSYGVLRPIMAES